MRVGTEKCQLLEMVYAPEGYSVNAEQCLHEKVIRKTRYKNNRYICDFYVLYFLQFDTNNITQLHTILIHKK